MANDAGLRLAGPFYSRAFMSIGDPIAAGS
jgi:hypothetical protein